MSEAEFYHSITQPAFAEYKERGSRFLAYVFPLTSVEDFKLHLQQLKKAHPKAVHHCFAYRLGLDGTQFRVSDDGEPAGTAGKPILGQIDSKQLTDVLIIVVRYFGGTLLGVPGLINAYKTASAMALQLTPVVRKAVVINIELNFDYTQLNNVMTLVKKFDCTILEQESQLFSRFKISVAKNRLAAFESQLKDLRGIEASRLA